MQEYLFSQSHFEKAHDVHEGYPPLVVSRGAEVALVTKDSNRNHQTREPSILADPTTIPAFWHTGIREMAASGLTWDARYGRSKVLTHASLPVVHLSGLPRGFENATFHSVNE